MKKFLGGFLGGILAVMAFLALIDKPEIHKSNKGHK